MSKTNDSVVEPEAKEPEAKEPEAKEPEAKAPEAKEPEAGKKPTLLTGEEKKADKPADYDIKLPEGFEVDADLLGALKSTAKDAESAQKLADVFFEGQRKASEKMQTEWEARQEGWLKEIKSNKDYEADQFAADAAMRQFGNDDLNKLLESSGLGNHPAMFRLMSSVGKALAENSVAGTNAGVPVKDPNKDPWEDRYDHPTSRPQR